MRRFSDKEIESICDQLADATPQAVGYRLMVKPIPAREGMEAAEERQFETLNRIAREKGTKVATKSDSQQARETHGSDIGVVVHVGPDAYSMGNLKGCDPWVKEGDVVIFKRYCGYCTELPPGSGNKIHFMSDDDIEGKYAGVNL